MVRGFEYEKNPDSIAFKKIIWRRKIVGFNPEIHHRRSMRLKGYDYSQAGAYFVTICSYNRACLFGNVIDDNMVLNEYGKIVETEWLKTPAMRFNVKLGEFVIMLNYFQYYA